MFDSVLYVIEQGLTQTRRFKLKECYGFIELGFGFRVEPYRKAH
jgi:hypothetical protein